jgi:hypothetical protein
MDAVYQLEWFALVHRILYVDPHHLSIIWVDQISIRNYPVQDQILWLVPGQFKTALAGIFKGMGQIIPALVNHTRDLVKQSVKTGR